MAIAAPGRKDSVAQPVRTSAPFLVKRPAEISSEEVTDSFLFAAYNVGWSLQDGRKTAKLLSQELLRVYKERRFHVIGISEIFEIDYVDLAMKEQVNERRQGILASPLADFNVGAAQPIGSGQPDICWHGRQDEHCFYLRQHSLNLCCEGFKALGYSRAALS